MPLVEPKIDDRDYNQILAEALARIPVHNPEWTNFNDSDPGVTLVQLFAFMTESLLYRSNLIPERNRIKFLKLLGVALEPATAAKGIVALSNPRGLLRTETLNAGTEVLAGQVPFRTQDGLNVLPIEAQVFYKSPLPEKQESDAKDLYDQLYASFLDHDVKLRFYETKLLEPPAAGTVFSTIDLSAGVDTLDGSLWVALLTREGGQESVAQARQAIADKVLTLGILPALSETSRVLLPGGPPSAAGQPTLAYHCPIGGTLPDQAELRVARYRPLEARPSGDLLSEPGVVQLVLPGETGLQLWDNLEPLETGAGDFPPSLDDTDVQDRVITWIRIQIRGNASEGGTSGQLGARLSWVGINAARVTQRVHVNAEDLGQGSGEPDQSVTLVNTPLIKESVELTVNGEPWQQIDDLLAAAPEVPVRSRRLTPSAVTTPLDSSESTVFTVDRESGEIRFGDGLHGKRPPRGAIIRASYDYGGGKSGNVGIGAINKSPSLLPGLKITNPIPTWGGDEAESVKQAEQRIPRWLRHRDRLVSETDYGEIAARTPGVDLGRVEILPLFHPDLSDALSPGVVTVMVIPASDPVQPDAPLPDRLFLDTVCEYLNPRRVLTTEVHVRGPQYVSLWVSVGIDVIPGRDIAPVRLAVEKELRTFLSPLTGGREKGGWLLDKAVERLELWAVAALVDGISKVNGVLLTDKTGSPRERVAIEGLELPRLIGLSVGSGDPQPLGELRGDAPSLPTGGAPGTEAPAKVVSVPTVPPECR